MLRLAPGKAEIIDETPSGRVHLDGRVLISEGAGLTRARRSLSFAGMIAITLVLDGKARLATDPAFVFEGIPEPVHEAVREAVSAAINRYTPKRGDDEKLREAIRRAAYFIFAPAAKAKCAPRCRASHPARTRMFSSGRATR